MEKIGLPCEEDLRALSLRAIVAYAVRCAERVQPLFKSDSEKHIAAVAEAIAVAQGFVRSKKIAAANAAAAAARTASHAAYDPAYYAANAYAANAYAAAITASHAAEATHYAANAYNAAIASAEAAARAAYDPDYDAADDARIADDAAEATQNAEAAARAAYDAARAAANLTIASAEAAARAAANAMAAARADCIRLREISGQQHGELGDPIDLSENGPLGPLWPEGPPEWFEAKEDERPGPTVQPDFTGRSLSVYLDPGDAPAELLTDFFVALASVYRSMGGSGLKIVKDERRSFVVEGVEL